MISNDLEQRIAAIAALDQPIRRDLYRTLAGSAGWTSRDAAATALEIPRSVAAFHLDKLAEAGVVEVRFERTSGRTGPGAGRPSKLYRPRDNEIAASVPDRHYDLAGTLLAEAVAESTGSGVAVDTCLHDVARAAGRRAAQPCHESDGAANPAGAVDELLDVLADHGYEPDRQGDEIRLANCPFHRLAEGHRELVCGMNLDYLDGLIDGTTVNADSPIFRARLAPEPGACCVRISVGQAEASTQAG